MAIKLLGQLDQPEVARGPIVCARIASSGGSPQPARNRANRFDGNRTIGQPGTASAELGLQHRHHHAPNIAHLAEGLPGDPLRIAHRLNVLPLSEDAGYNAIRTSTHCHSAHGELDRSPGGTLGGNYGINAKKSANIYHHLSAHAAEASCSTTLLALSKEVRRPTRAPKIVLTLEGALECHGPAAKPGQQAVNSPTTSPHRTSIGERAGTEPFQVV